MSSIVEQKNNIIRGVLNTDSPATLMDFEDLRLLDIPCPNIPAATPEN